MSTTEDRRLEQTDAISFALRGEWQAAIDANIALLKAHPNDIEALNRLAKACFEINAPVTIRPSDYNPHADTEAESSSNDNIAIARTIYEYVLSLSSSNMVARNMLTLIARTSGHSTKQRTFMDMRNFVIETGTTTITSIHVDAAGTLDLVPGEIVKLHVVGNSDPESEIHADATAIDVYDSNDLLIGRLDPSLALRIIRFMRNQNIYEAAVWRFSDHQQHIEIIVREVYAHPDNRNEVSFPGKLVEENERRMIVDDVEDDDAADDVEEEETTEETDSDAYAGDDDEEHERLESLDQNANDDSENED